MTTISSTRWAGKQGRMDTEREAELVKLRAQIAHGDYRVDPHAVAEAILRRMRLEALRGQNECSNPASLPSTSAKTNPGGPSMTWPIQVNPILSVAASASSRAAGGMQTHSS